MKKLIISLALLSISTPAYAGDIHGGKNPNSDPIGEIINHAHVEHKKVVNISRNALLAALDTLKAVGGVRHP
jgi:hypothetical protein